MHVENNLTNYFLFVLTNQKNKLSNETEKSPIDTSESRSDEVRNVGQTSSSKARLTQ